LGEKGKGERENEGDLRISPLFPQVLYTNMFIATAARSHFWQAMRESLFAELVLRKLVLFTRNVPRSAAYLRFLQRVNDLGVPLDDVRTNPEIARQASEWLESSELEMQKAVRRGERKCPSCSQGCSPETHPVDLRDYGACSKQGTPEMAAFRRAFDHVRSKDSTAMGRLNISQEARLEACEIFFKLRRSRRENFIGKYAGSHCASHARAGLREFMKVFKRYGDASAAMGLFSQRLEHLSLDDVVTSITNMCVLFEAGVCVFACVCVRACLCC
jgi:hypothetical protein